MKVIMKSKPDGSSSKKQVIDIFKSYKKYKKWLAISLVFNVVLFLSLSVLLTTLYTTTTAIIK